MSNSLFKNRAVVTNLYTRGLSREVQFNLLPHWGVSTVRQEILGTGDTIAETGGEIEFPSGTTGSYDQSLVTKEFTQYRSGLWGDAGLAIRMEGEPVGNQVARWGMFEDDNGFGWGVDANGIFVFRRKGGNETRYYQQEGINSEDAWNTDSLDGTGRSRLNLDLTDGEVFHTLFRWYGHGPFISYVEKKVGDTNLITNIDVHRQLYFGEALTEDPNQRLRVQIENNGTSGNNFSLFIGGRQFSLWGKEVAFQNRTPTAILRDQTISTSDTWVPLAAIRKKPTFNGRTNSIRCTIKRLRCLADATFEARVTVDATSDATFGSTFEGVPSDESAMEVDYDPDNFTVTSDGFETLSTFGDAGFFTSGVAQTPTEAIPLGTETHSIIWGRTPAGSVTFDYIYVDIEEQW